MNASGRPTLLVVDDNEMNRDMLSRRLERQGYDCDSLQATAGRRWTSSTASAFALVLLDIEMPDMTGLEVLKTVRQRYSPIELPIIMVTARQQQPETSSRR